jgi:hypothetical protein
METIMNSTTVIATLPATSKPRRHRTLRKRIRRVAAILAGVLVLLSAAFAGLSAFGGNHTMGSVTYAQVPPNSGNHSPVWQRCGFYSEPVRDEHAVHSLEHGAVWITYQPGLPQDQIEILRELTRGRNDLLVSPYSGIPAPVVISAWGQQIRLDSADDATIDRALREIRNGPPAPEPGAGCEGPNLLISGATGNPE